MTRKQKKELLRILVAALLLVVCWCLPLDGWWALLYLIPYAVAGWDVLWSAGEWIFRQMQTQISKVYWR